MDVIERDAVVLSFWECGHIEIEDGSSHECDGRGVCVAKWRAYVPADPARRAVEALRQIVAHSEMPADESWPTAYGEVVFMARDALDALGGQS
jgi:hypothetical protein